MDEPTSPIAPSTPAWPPVAVPGQGPHLDVEPSSTEDEEPQQAAEGAELLDELREAIARYVILPSGEALTAVTLWVAASHIQPALQHAPRLAVVGPAKRCGKSRLLDVLTETVRDPLITVNTSPAVVFRSIGDEPPTLLVDEADTIFGSIKAAEKNEELRGLLNAGHQRNRPALRISGPEHKPQAFPTFAMAALAGIGDLPDTAWLRPLLDTAADLVPPMPVQDRAADTWEPLVVVAELAGGSWPEQARDACVAMCAAEEGQDDESNLKTRLLRDIRRVFARYGDPDIMRTRDLLEELLKDQEAPWAEYRNTGLTSRHLGILLKDFGIQAAVLRFEGGRQARGFAHLQFTDAWARYCPEEPTPSSGDESPRHGPGVHL